MPYAGVSDVNVHLPDDKAQILDGEMPNLLLDAERTINSRLASTFEATDFASWTEPAETPEIIRAIAGKLVAAKFYANLVAEDQADGSVFAQNLYNEAIQELNDIRDGILTVIGVDGNPLINDSLTETSFLPNNSTQDPFFAVADQWA